LNEIL